MKAIAWTKYGDPDVLVVKEIQKPSFKDNEILIKVKATTVTLGDCEIRSMSLPLAFKLPIKLFLGFRKPRSATLGQEFSGIVESVGKSITRFSKGDEVFGQTGMSMGAYSQYMIVPENGIITKKPENISFEEATCVPLGGLEAWHFLKQSDIDKTSKVLVIGAGGSIGTMGIQLAKYLDANVTGIDREEKFSAMKQAGADNCIDYTKEDYMNSGVLYDAILDVVGKTPLRSGLRLLKEKGLYMHANPKVSQMLFKYFISKSSGKKIMIKVSEQSQNDLDVLKTMLEEGKIKPIIDKVMPLEEIVKAHKYVEAGHKKGNLVIRVNH